jgi:hypothetical protein
MKKLRYIQTWVQIAVAVSGVASICVNAQVSSNTTELNAREMKAVQAAAQKPAKVALWALTQEFTGSFETMPKQFDEFNKEFETQKLASNFKTRPTSVIILHEDPTGKSEFRFSLGLEVPRRFEVKTPLKIEQLEKPEAVRFTHVGPYQRLKAVHDAIEVNLKKSRYANAAPGSVRKADWPVVMRLLNDPRKVQPAQLRTEIIVPAS